MHKQTLQKLTLVVITGMGIGFLAFAINQMRIDTQAQNIVRYNSRLVTEFQENTRKIANELLAIKVKYDEQLSPEQKQFLNKMRLQSKKLAQAIAKTETQQGINIPSKNNQDIVRQKLAELKKINLSFSEIGYLHICLNQQIIKANILQKKLDQLFKSYALGTTYIQNQQILTMIDQSYRAVNKNLDSMIACFGKQLQNSTLYSSLQEVINNEQKAIKNYHQQYLEPLLQFYSRGDYLGAIEFQNQNAKAGQIRLLFPNLFKAQKHDLDVFRASYSSYVESEISNLILEAIASW